jgi:hypothetical protein
MSYFIDELKSTSDQTINNPKSKLKVKVIYPEKTDWLRGCNFMSVGYTFNYASNCLEHLYNVCRNHNNIMGWK